MWVRRVLVFKAKSPILEEGWLLASSDTEVGRAAACVFPANLIRCKCISAGLGQPAKAVGIQKFRSEVLWYSTA